MAALVIILFSPLVLIIICSIINYRVKAAQEAARVAAENRKRKERAENAARVKQEKERQEAARKEAQAIKAAERANAQKAKEEERKRKQAEKMEAARQLAEYQERALRAERELRALRTEKPASAPAVSLDEFAARILSKEKSVNNAPKPFDAPQSFAHEIVAFTGTLPTMTRAEAIAATQERGGRGYKTINTHCTLLVVGQRPGRQQQERAASWNIPTITWEEWFKRAEISWRRRQYMQALKAEKAAS